MPEIRYVVNTSSKYYLDLFSDIKYISITCCAFIAFNCLEKGGCFL